MSRPVFKAMRKIQAFRFSTCRHLGLVTPALDERLLQGVAGVLQVADQVVERPQQLRLVPGKRLLQQARPAHGGFSAGSDSAALRVCWVTLMPSTGLDGPIGPTDCNRWMHF